MSKPEHAKKKKSNAKLYVWLSACIILLVVVIAAAYTLTQTPEKIVASGMSKLVGAQTLGIDASVKTAAAGQNVAVKLNARMADDKIAGTASGEIPGSSFASSKPIAFKADIFAEKDTAYLKLHDAQNLVNTTLGSMFKAPDGVTPEVAAMYEQMNNVYREMGKKIDNKWIKLSEEDMKNSPVTQGSTDDSCSADLSSVLMSSKKVRSELAGVYNKHQFIAIDKELDKKDGNPGYRLKIDKKGYKEFKKAVEDTKFVKNLKDKKCYEDTLTFGMSGDSQTTFDVWVDRFGRTITQIEQKTAEDAGTTTTAIKFNYRAKVTESAPKAADTITLDDLIPKEMQTAASQV